MIFPTVHSALRWYQRTAEHDGIRARWPDPHEPTIARRFGDGRASTILVCVAIARALAALPAPDRHVLILFHLRDMPAIEIAARWQRHPSRVYAALSRATRRLSDRLRAEGLLHSTWILR